MMRDKAKRPIELEELKQILLNQAAQLTDVADRLTDSTEGQELTDNEKALMRVALIPTLKDVFMWQLTQFVVEGEWDLSYLSRWSFMVNN